MQLISINELNVFGFMLKRLARGRTYALCVFPFFPPLEGLLRRLVEVTARADDTPWADGHVAALSLFEKNPAEIEYAHIYPRDEQSLNTIYGIGQQTIGDDTLAYQHAASNWLKLHLGKLVRLHEVSGPVKAGEIELANLPRDLSACYKAVYGEDLPGRTGPGPGLNTFVNFMISGVVLISTLADIVRRSRFAGARKTGESYLLGADLSHEDSRSFFIQIVETPKDILFVLRNQEVVASLAPESLSRYYHADLRQGRFFGLAEIFSAIGESAARVMHIFHVLHGVNCGLFFATAKLVRRRMLFRALFNRFTVKNFIARDEYNPEHIVRSQELRRREGRSMGITHGMSTGPRVYPHTRYLDFDLLYVFGERQRAAYADTWPETMTVRPIGAFRPTRVNWSRVGLSRQNDILIFGNQDTDPPEHVEITRKIARAFQDRKVIIKLKYRRDYIGPARYDPYMAQLGELPDNVEITDLGRPYELMQRARYSFSGLSTVVAEAVQMGMFSFFIDVYRPDQDIFFRDFPGLCVTSADDAIKRIHDLETGSWSYPFDSLADLIDCSGANPYDAIRADLGLAPLSHDASPILPATDKQEIKRIAL